MSYHIDHPSKTPKSTISLPLSTFSSSLSPPTSPIAVHQHHEPQFARRIGIEYIDGLLLNGRNNTIFEVNLETPETVVEIYQKYGSFVKNTQIPADLEDLLKEAFIGGDWDEDSERGYLKGFGTNLGCLAGGVIHAGGKNNSNSNLVLSNPSRYRKELKNKPIIGYTLIRSLEYLNSQATAIELEEYKKYQEYIHQKRLEIAQKCHCDNNYNYCYNLHDDTNFKIANLSNHFLQNNNNNNSTPRSPQLEYSSPIPTSQSELHLNTSFRNSRELLLSPMGNMGDIPVGESYIQTESFDNNSNSSLFPDPIFVPKKLQKKIENSLCYRPNSHTMFCLTIREVTNKLDKLRKIAGNDGDIVLGSNNEQIDTLQIGLQNTAQNNNSHNRINTPTSTQNDHDDITILDQEISHGEQLNDVYGIALCRVLHVNEILEWIPPKQRNELADFVTENQIRYKIEKNEFNFEIDNDDDDDDNNNHDNKIKLNPSPPTNNSNQPLTDTFQQLHINEQHSNSISNTTPHITKALLDSLPIASPNDISTFLQSSAMTDKQHNHNCNRNNTNWNHNHDSQIKNNQSPHFSVEQPNNNNYTHSSVTIEEIPNDSEDGNTMLDKPTIYCPIIEIPDEEYEEEIEQNNKMTTNEQNNDKIQTKFQSLLTSTQFSNQSAVTNSHWLKIELISMLPEHRSKGCGNLLLLSALLAGSLCEKFALSKTNSPKHSPNNSTNNFPQTQPHSLFNQNSPPLPISPTNPSSPSHTPIFYPSSETKFTPTHPATNPQRPIPHQIHINNAVLSLAGGSIDNAGAAHLYEKVGFTEIPSKRFFQEPNRNMFVLLQMNKVLKKVRWGDLIAGMHHFE